MPNLDSQAAASPSIPLRVSTPGRVPIDVVLPTALVPELAFGFARGDDLDLTDRRPPRRSRRPDPEGRITALRGVPVAVDDPPPLALVAPEVAATDRVRSDAGGFPFAAVLTSAVSATVAAVFFSPIFAVLAAVSALAMVGRWFGSHLASTRARQRRSAALAQAADEWNRQRLEWGAAAASARRASALVPGDLLEWIEPDRGRARRSPWSVRVGGVDDVPLAVGRGRMNVDLPIASVVAGSGMVDPRALGLSVSVDLEDVPVSWPVGSRGGIAVCGDRADVMASARWLIASVVTAIGPADLRLLIVTTADRVVDWDWAKWLPSLRACVVVDVDGADLLVDGPSLVVVDGAEPSGPSPLARLLAGRVEAARVVWLGDADAVPGGCGARLDVSADGSGILSTQDSSTALEWFGLDDDEVDRVARWLAPFDDPEVDDLGARLPRSISLRQIGDALAEAGPTSVGSTSDLRRVWDRATLGSLSAAIGVDVNGVHVVDLVADGPHVLAAGTTGSGKSELLRTLVVSTAAAHPPDLVSFVLIDFKGGGAFDVVADLPHVAAVVTDLDRTEATRALRGLRAELLDREGRLREMECSDLVGVDRGHELAFGRLVVVVDEFATLADELPDFLGGLVDIARRGRSLGVHLVLATQRPSGVVTGQIRSNTNLRLCLRVQDRADSADVIDAPDAALLPRVPGRAIVQQGGGGRTAIQVAQIHAPRASTMVERFVVHPSVPVVRQQAVSESAITEQLGFESSRRSGRDPDEGSLVDELVRMATELGAERAEAPWRPPLGPVGFPVIEREGSGHAVVGLLDDPDRRRLVPLRWDPDRDGLLIVGVDEAEIARSAVTAVCALLDRPGCVPLPVFVFDGRPGRSDALRDVYALAPVIDVVAVDEPERLVKAVDHVSGVDQPIVVVIHDWQSVVDVLSDLGGPMIVERLVRLVRRSGMGSTKVIVTARSDRDVPQRAAAQLGLRLVHRLGDTGGYLSFGLRSSDVPDLQGSAAVEPSSGLTAVLARVDAEALARLQRKLADSCPGSPLPVRLLPARVERCVLPAAKSVEDGWQVPVGLDEELSHHWVEVAAARPVIVVGHPGTGRSTTLATLGSVSALSAAGTAGLRVLDDAGELEAAALDALLDECRTRAEALVLACGPADIRRLGSPIARLAATATLIVLNPGRAEADVVRAPLPDLSDQPVGRAAVIARGRATVVQIAS